MRKPCCEKEDMNKGAWSEQEDQKLIDYIKKHGEGRWRTLPKAAGLLRCGKSCRLRWINYLRPDLKRGNFGEDEEDLIIKLHALLGNRWSLIAGRLPGRTDNEVKNYWNSHLRRKLINMGIDPKNHRLGRPQSHSTSPGGAPSASKDQAFHLVNSGSGSDQVSDAGSSVENDLSLVLPDLNLDVAANSVPSGATNGHEQTRYSQSLVLKELEHPPSPTLQLFI